jgi:hypothetical protein|uniref:Tubulin alpha 3f pseudogene n=1 Tax=Homo sapiens TaxID=9606 RepID=A0A994J5G1_HUMAN
MSGSCQRSGEDKKQEEEATAACGRLAGVPEAKQGPKADSDSDLETEGARGRGQARLLPLGASPAGVVGGGLAPPRRQETSVQQGT